MRCISCGVYHYYAEQAYSSIIPQIKGHFKVDRVVEEDKDTILFHPLLPH